MGWAAILDHVTWTNYINLALNGQAILEKKSFEDGVHINVYSTGTRAGNPGVNYFPLTYFFSQLCPLLQLSPLDFFITVFPI